MKVLAIQRDKWYKSSKGLRRQDREKPNHARDGRHLRRYAGYGRIRNAAIAFCKQ